MPLFARIPLEVRLAAIRQTPEKPPRMAVLDALAAVKGTANEGYAWTTVRRARVDLTQRCGRCQRSRRGGRKSLVADSETLCQIVARTPWRASLKCKRAALVALMRHVGGDETIVDECLRGAMDHDSDAD